MRHISIGIITGFALKRYTYIILAVTLPLSISAGYALAIGTYFLLEKGIFIKMFANKYTV